MGKTIDGATDLLNLDLSVIGAIKRTRYFDVKHDPNAANCICGPVSFYWAFSLE